MVAGGRVLMLLPGLSDGRLTGPEIRGWEIARALTATFPVSVAASVSSETTREGIRLVPHRRARLLRELLGHDIVIAAWLPPFLLAAARLAGRHVVADLYDPIEFELQDEGRDAVRERRSIMELTRMQLDFADTVTCGSEAQVARLEEMLESSARRPAGPRLICVPFGVPPPPDGVHKSGRLKGLLGRGAGEDDVVALWWGSVWKWLDAETPLRAMKRLASREPRLKLVISAATPPSHEAQRLTRNEDTRALARELDLLGRTVFFLEDWIPYGSRSDVLAEADIGISFHRDDAEAAVAARARYLDLVWMSVPMVLTPGDEFGDELIERGAALSVSAGDEDAAADALLRLARDPELRRSARLAAAEVGSDRRWSNVVAPLTAGLREATAGGRRMPRRGRGLGRATLRYYGLRARDKLSGRFDRDGTRRVERLLPGKN